MKFITREELNKELEKKGYAEVLGYYYYDVCNYKYEQNIKSKSTDIYDVLNFDQDVIIYMVLIFMKMILIINTKKEQYPATI